MRIDLTQGAFRVLSRAENHSRRQGVSIAEILHALLEEEESRAFRWLGELHVRLEEFRTQFGFYRGLSDEIRTTLHSPVSAPMFPMGAYGVPPGMNDTSKHSAPPDIALSDAAHREYPAGYDPVVSERFSSRKEERECSVPRNPAAPLFAKTPPLEGFQAPRAVHAGMKSETSSILWFLNDRPVRFSKILLEVDHAIFATVHALRRTAELLDTSFVLDSGGAVMRIKPNYNLGFLDPAFELASEHLLLASVLSEDRLGVGRWLREKGVDPKTLLGKIDALYGRTSAFSRESSPEPSLSNADVSRIADAVASDSLPGEIVPENSSTPRENLENDGDNGDNSENDDNGENDNAPQEHRVRERFTSGRDAPFSTARLARLLDASINRGHEAVRVLEDYVRFVLDDPYLSAQLKAFRHDFSSWSACFPDHERILSRDTEGDVGTVLEGRREYRRKTLGDVLASNFSRLQESLRSLEEFSKLFSPDLAREAERLRYRCYTLHKLAAGADFSRTKLDRATLYVLLDARDREGEFAQLARSLIATGVGAIQLRDKNADDRTLLARGRLLREMTSGTRTLFIMNDRPDLAKLAGADGVHVGQEELGVREVRNLLGGSMLVGVSAHTIDQARRAVLDGANYIGVGPTFPSTTKTFLQFPGLEFLREVAAEIRIPAFAIGGITLENVPQVLQTGVSRIAVGAAVLDALDAARAARSFLERLSVDIPRTRCRSDETEKLMPEPIANDLPEV